MNTFLMSCNYEDLARPGGGNNLLLLVAKPGTRDINIQRAAQEVCAIESQDRQISFLAGGHFHYAETFGAVGITIHNNFYRADGSVFCKCTLEIFVGS